jgi:hypothetical protein
MELNFNQRREVHGRMLQAVLNTYQGPDEDLFDALLQVFELPLDAACRAIEIRNDFRRI